MNHINPQVHGIKYVQATIAASALTLADIAGITAGHLAVAKKVTLSVRTNAINYTTDGTSPTVGTGVADGTGHYVATLSTIEIYGNGNINSLKLIRSGGSSALVDITIEG